MLIAYCHLFILGFFSDILSVKGCERSLEVRGVEDYCWTKNVEVIDRLEHTGKSILNFAKKKLGMDVETDGEEQKCDYYNCMLQELKMLNGDGFPCRDRITTWIKNNIVYNHAATLLSRADECSAGLKKSIASKTFFSIDRLEETTLLKETTFSSNEVTETPLELQSKCDIVAEYVKCMSVVEKSEDCPVFQYP